MRLTFRLRQRIVSPLLDPTRFLRVVCPTSLIRDNIVLLEQRTG